MEKNDRAEYLSDLLAIDLEDIADRCVDNNWKRIGLLFEDTHHFLMPYKKLQDSNPKGTDDETLRRCLFEHIARHQITIEELACVLDDTRIGMRDVAKYLRTTHFKNKNAPSLKNVVSKRSLSNVQIVHSNAKERSTYSNKFLVVPNGDDELSSSVDGRNQPEETKEFSWLPQIPTKIHNPIDTTEQLANIDLLLRTNKTVTINGMSGLGKTTLAAEYGYKYGSKFNLALWIDCRTQHNIVKSYVRIVERILQIPAVMKESDLPTLDKYVEDYNLGRLKDYLQEHKCLIVYDSCNERDTLGVIFNNLYPTSKNVKAIITTQLPQWPIDLPATSYIMQRYSKESAIEYMLRLIPPRSSKTKESASATEIYTMYGGMTIFLTLITKYIAQKKTTFTAYLTKIKNEKQKMTNSILDVSVEKIPLLMIIRELDEQSLFIMRVLAITYAMPLNDLSSMSYFVPYSSETRDDDFKECIAHLIDRSLVKIDEDWIIQQVSIGHEIIQTYLKSTMTSDIIEGVVDKWFEEATIESDSNKIFTFYADVCKEESKICTKLAEIVGIWDNTDIAVHRIAQGRLCTAPVITFMVAISLDQDAIPSRIDSLKSALSDYQQHQDDTILSMITELQLSKYSDHNIHNLYHKTKSKAALSKKYLKLHLEVQLQYARQLLKEGNIDSATEELKQCKTTTLEKFPQYVNLQYKENHLLFQTHSHLIYSCHLDPLQAIPVLFDFIKWQASEKNWTMIFNEEKQPLVPQVLYPSENYGISNFLPALLSKRQSMMKTEYTDLLYFPLAHSIISTKGYHEFHQASLGRYAISLWYDGPNNPFVALLEAIELGFPLWAVRPEIILTACVMISKSIKWKAAANAFKEYRYQDRWIHHNKESSVPSSKPLDYSKTPLHTAQPPQIVGDDAYMFFTKTLQFVHAGVTIQQFLDEAIHLLFPDKEDQAKQLEERLKDTTIPSHFIKGTWTNTVHYSHF